MGDRFAILVGGTTDGLCGWRDRNGGGCDLGVERVVGIEGNIFLTVAVWAWHQVRVLDIGYLLSGVGEYTSGAWEIWLCYYG